MRVSAAGFEDSERWRRYYEVIGLGWDARAVVAQGAPRKVENDANALSCWPARSRGSSASAFGAFGAHGLRGRLSPEMLAVFETGVRYQMYHALALLLMAALAGPPRRPR